MAKYSGKYPLFNLDTVQTYPLSDRSSKVDLAQFWTPEKAMAARTDLPGEMQDDLAGLAEKIAACARDGKPVLLFSGAHPIKNGFSPLIIDLLRRGVLSCYGTNGAGAIHTFEFALTGASSESVVSMLPDGRFGMAFETGAYLNAALRLAAERGFGFGEALGRLYCSRTFRTEVVDLACAALLSDETYLKPYDGFPFVETSIFAAAWECSIPAGVHASIGTDIIDQHPSFDGAAKGAASGIDFLVFAEMMRRCRDGGVFLNLGSAVTGPEVALKAVSMAANCGCVPRGLWTADFDLRPAVFHDTDDSVAGYYYRDQKSVVTRIPAACGGRGWYFQGLHRNTFIRLYQNIITILEEQ